MVQGFEKRWIAGFADTDETCAGLAGLFHLRLRFRGGCNAHQPVDAAGNHQFGQHFECRLGRTEAVDQIAKGGGADILRADQAQPGNPLPVAETKRGCPPAHPLAPIRPSVPAKSREMLARCLTKTITLMTANSAATCGWAWNHSATGTATAAVSAASEE